MGLFLVVLRLLGFCLFAFALCLRDLVFCVFLVVRVVRFGWWLLNCFGCLVWLGFEFGFSFDYVSFV